MSKSKTFVDVPVSRLLLDQVADKWSVLALSTLKEKPLKFNEVRLAAAGIAHDQLTTCLRRFERNGFITKTTLSTEPVSIEYAITELGKSLLVPYAALQAWTEANVEAVEKANTRFDEFQRVRKSK